VTLFARLVLALMPVHMNEVPDAVIDIYQIPSSGAATVQAFVAEEYIASGVSPGALYLTSFGGQPAECRASSGNSIANLPPSIPLGMLYGAVIPYGKIMIIRTFAKP